MPSGYFATTLIRQRADLEEFWSKTLAAYKQVAEKSTQEDQ
jgi:hypothetical protein